jgi:transketolase C-terminal domain/subunit
LLFTVEDHSIHTGLGASVALCLSEKGSDTRLVRLGVEGYQPSGASSELFARAGLDSAGIARRIREELRRG